MSDLMAIVSKAVFEKDAKKAKLGDVLPIKVYRSASKHLGKLEAGGRLFLVTVRPPDEALWLVAVLDQPKFDGKKWEAGRNRYPVTDISVEKDKLKFDSGKGIVAKKGALGMSLQTPRTLTAADAELLINTAGGPPPPRPEGPPNVAHHDESGPLPCLCSRCLPTVPEALTHDGLNLFRARIEAQGRCLWFWVPADLKEDLPAIAQTVERALKKRLKPYGAKKRHAAVYEGDVDDDGE